MAKVGFEEKLRDLSCELLDFMASKNVKDSLFIMALGNAFINALRLKAESSIKFKVAEDVKTTIDLIEDTQDALIDIKIKGKMFLEGIEHV